VLLLVPEGGDFRWDVISGLETYLRFLEDLGLPAASRLGWERQRKCLRASSVLYLFPKCVPWNSLLRYPAFKKASVLR